MTEETPWQLEPTYILQQLELFNWGGFSRHHRVAIDPAGTAIVGPTGSGKTTLVDALMTLLTANPKYNLASTGGHESDRDLVSYVRGVSGPGDGSSDQSHIARNGKTITAICATLFNGENIARLGALLWFDDASSSPGDMKKLWLFSTSAEQNLEHWLSTQQQGGMRALRQMDKNETGIWSFTSKKSFLARIRDFFEVRDNAFNLLNRAAGLKQLNSIDEIFRELVLDDESQFSRAREVADSFDDLTAIHEELEIARRQQRSLEPVKISWENYQKNQQQLTEKNRLEKLLPVWFGEQAYSLWQQECQRLTTELQQSDAQRQQIESDYQITEKQRDQLQEAYLKLGGSDIATLEQLIGRIKQELKKTQLFADQYQALATKLSLATTLDHPTFSANKARAEQLNKDTLERLEHAQQQVFDAGVTERKTRQDRDDINREMTEIKNRPGSNIPYRFQQFRSQLADELNIDEEELPFVAELVQVKPEQQQWQGAIERAIGSHRLRILVPPESVKEALRWVNQRHHQLHVRILEANSPASPIHFFDDGFTRKLEFKAHPHRDAVKQLLGGIDRHCVETPEQLRDTPHAMTQQGLMSGKKHFFDKQDQKRLDEDWQTGFSNHNRLQFLQNSLEQISTQQQDAEATLQKAKNVAADIAQQQQLIERLQSLDFDTIDCQQREQELHQCENKLQQLLAPDSDISGAKQALDDVVKRVEKIDGQRIRTIELQTRISGKLEQAKKEQDKAFRKAEVGIPDEYRSSLSGYFSLVKLNQVADISDIERQELTKLQTELDKLKNRSTSLTNELVRKMSDAQREDRGALAEVGRDLDDVPEYLQRLKLLTEEALPEKRRRFKEYLNRSSDDGVTQLLQTIDAEVGRIEEKLDDVNSTLYRVDFQHQRYLQLVSNKVMHESLRTFNKAKSQLISARLIDDEGESHYKALQHIVSLLRDACERHRTGPAKALLDPRFRLEFKVEVRDRDTGRLIETRSGSQGGSGGEKEIIASYVLTASLSYALCPDGSSRPLFGSIVLDEAFSRSSHAVAGRIIAALKEFGLHALFITPNKEMRLLRNHTRSAIVVHRRGTESRTTSLSWLELEHKQQTRSGQSREITD